MPSQYYEYPIDPDDKRTTHAWLLRFTEGAGSILEIGCSTGFLGRLLTTQGCQVVGVEIDSSAASRAQLHYTRLIVGDVETENVQSQINQRFDAVILGDVLEHLKSPRDLLCRIKDKWLHPNGKVVLSVPNSGHWVFRREVLLGRFPYRDYGLFDRSHLRFYTRSSLYRMVSECGYTIRQSAYALNFNTQDDLTFRSLTPFYQYYQARKLLMKLEASLARLVPTLFAYQFILSIRPAEFQTP
jgi:SAM-dependent methyltransferase